jgi:hypothetical protein
MGLYGVIFRPCATKLEQILDCGFAWIFRPCAKKICSKFWIVGLYGVIFRPCATKFVANFGLWVCMV